MSDTAMTPPATPSPSAESRTPILALADVTKAYGTHVALSHMTLSVYAGEVTCVLGDNGAGKSTLIKTLSGLHKPTEGRVLIDGETVALKSPKDAIARGISTVFQDLAVVPDMPVWRNFYLGHEVVRGPNWLGMVAPLDAEHMKKTTDTALKSMGIDLPDVTVPISTLSGGQRQVVAIARAVHFGARAIILDEPTAALGVKQSGMVLRFVQQAKERGLGVILITHNPHHAYLVGDHFVLLGHGRMQLDAGRQDITLEQLTAQMAGGEELESLSHELGQVRA